jgi:HPt (histidine-containing phosphotransfer) domain-containing protein
VEIERIREIADGDPEFEQELIEAFLSDCEEQIRCLEVSMGRKDGEEVRLRAHAIKGSSANAGAKGVQEVAVRLEEIALEKGSALALETVSDLKDAFEEAREYLQTYLRSAESSSGEDEAEEGMPGASRNL